MNDKELNQQKEISTLPSEKSDTQKPSLYKVVMLNDDFTPMEFVVEVLVTIFDLNKNNATKIMLDIHTKGKGICGIYTYEIAETRVDQVMKMAKHHQHPLLCSMEED